MQELTLIKENPVVLSNKEGITGMVDKYIEDIAFNGGDVLRDWAMCEKYSVLVGAMKEGLKPYVIKELEFCDKRETRSLGTDIKVVASGVKYDYSESKVWLDQKKRADEESARLKDIETFLKSLKAPMTSVDEETGEAVTHYPPSKSSTETIRSSVD
jgi:hypothetical protein